jgi:hypothetical protein
MASDKWYTNRVIALMHLDMSTSQVGLKDWQMSGENNQKALDYLLQRDFLERFIPSIGKAQWQVVYKSYQDSNENGGVLSALLDERHVVKALESTDYDMIVGGLPSFGQHWEAGQEVTT